MSENYTFLHEDAYKGDKQEWLKEAKEKLRNMSDIEFIAFIADCTPKNFLQENKNE